MSTTILVGVINEYMQLEDVLITQDPVAADAHYNKLFEDKGYEGTFNPNDMRDFARNAADWNIIFQEVEIA